MNRHDRRASVKSIRHSDLITHLIAADVALDDHAMLHNAVLHWYANIAARRPICISCKLSFLDAEARVGAFLLSIPVGVPEIVVASAFCTSCHATLSASEVDTIATRTLQQLVPGGKFQDGPP